MSVSTRVCDGVSSKHRLDLSPVHQEPAQHDDQRDHVELVEGLRILAWCGFGDRLRVGVVVTVRVEAMAQG